MESIDITTGQNIVIKYEPAGIIRRMFALLIDFIIITVYVIVIIFLIVDWKIDFPTPIENFLLFVFLAPAVLYFLLFEVFSGGRTPGKMALGIRVTMADGTRPSLTSYFLRYLLLPIDFSTWLGALFILFSKKQQRIGDMAAGTIVVRHVKPPVLDLDKDFYEFLPDYKPTFPQVELLSDGQIRFISNILFGPKNKRSISSSISSLSQKVKEVIKVESSLEDRLFLETVVRDYNYYAAQN